MGIVFSGAALAAALYMSWLAALDWGQRRILAGESARGFAVQACAALAGCNALEVRGGFDWKRSTRRVLYSLSVEPGTEGERAKGELLARAAKRDGMLGWALRAEPQVQVRAGRARASAPPTERRRKSK